jgi:hypothetical protein
MDQTSYNGVERQQNDWEEAKWVRDIITQRKRNGNR